ncbi:hypothetical protein [Peribacillus sp. FSL M8-0224]|uniref:hypothetical protein n=1 Tax=Peribacillus sp. FSL M8-0224 TaxID=2921568 RepID=UPI0030F954A7
METKRRGIIDMDTGWLLQELRPKTEQQMRYAAKKRAIEEGKGPNFIACFPQELRKINRELTLIEAGAAMRLLGFLRWKENGRLINEGKSLTIKDLSKIFKKGLTATKDILNRLESFELVSRSREGRANAFFINPRFFQFGGKINSKDFTKLFVVESRNLVNDLSIQEAGLLWKIIPHFNYENYYLCVNPTEKDAKHMSRETLAAHIKHDPKTVGKLMSGLNRRGAVLITQTLGSKRYLINPDLMYRKSYEDETTRNVRGLFEQHRKNLH